MASKKEAEGIMLLSMYNDEEDDDDMEDATAVDDGGGEGREVMVVEDGDRMKGEEGRRPSEREENNRVFGEEEVEEDEFVGVNEGDRSARAVVVEVRRTAEKVAIVDYAHDEVAVSPGNEEEEIQGESIVVVHESQSVSGDFQDTFTEETIQVIFMPEPLVHWISFFHRHQLCCAPKRSRIK
ncbi:hypothetical protein MLD38_021184 [Melastoma candidum]|uniref:Uncharacterized protein n=1 Tax=Melastoma candidum TaxID=119954 RepID=A0ACB9QF64_9MYRT|nr:hypothetical protein MLD38_021184 [Melastoma candidum]